MARTFTIGYDAAWSPPTPAQLVAAGAKFFIGYLSSDPSKNILDGERKALHAAGLDVGLVFENEAGGMKNGYSHGRLDAASAYDQAIALGVPAGVCIYFACDWDATPAQQAAINAYMDGVREVFAGRYQHGAYAGYYPLKRLFDAGKIMQGWQTYAWSGGQLDERAAIYQYLNGVKVAGHDCDLNKRFADGGLWNAKGVVMANSAPWPTVDDAAHNAALALFYGGTSCGSKVPAAAGTTDETGAEVTETNSVIGKLDYLIRLMEEIKSAKQEVTLSDTAFERLADLIVNRTDNPLGDADQPAIKAALTDVLGAMRLGVLPS